MPNSTREDFKKIKRGVKGTAKGSPAIGGGLAIARIGDEVIKRTPKGVRDVVGRATRAGGRMLRGARSYLYRKGRELRHQARRRR